MRALASLNQRGVTLIELMTALALMTVMALIAVPNLGGILERVKLEADARQLAWVFRQARQEAIIQGKPQIINIYQETEEYSWLSNGKTRRYRVTPGIDLVTANYASFSTSGPPACSFNTTGVPGHAGTAVLRNKYGEKRYVIVSAVIGRIRVSEAPPASWIADETY